MPVSPYDAGIAYKFLVGAVKRKGYNGLLFQPRHPLPRIRHLGERGIGVPPESEELLVILKGFGFVPEMEAKSIQSRSNRLL